MKNLTHRTAQIAETVRGNRPEPSRQVGNLFSDEDMPRSPPGKGYCTPYRVPKPLEIV